MGAHCAAAALTNECNDPLLYSYIVAVVMLIDYLQGVTIIKRFFHSNFATEIKNLFEVIPWGVDSNLTNSLTKFGFSHIS